MSAIDDARTLVQDIVVPDLKALTARMDALEKSVKVGFETSEKSSTQRIDAVEKLAEARHDLMLLRMETGFAAVDAKLAAILATMDARFAAMELRFDALNKSLNTDRRLELLEAAQAKVQ